MGKFIYENSFRADFDDRVLAHLQVVVGNKLRRNEPFYFTWREDQSSGGGRTTVWMHSRANLAFKFYGSRMPPLNREWLDALMFSANSASGLQVVPEPAGPPERAIESV